MSTEIPKCPDGWFAVYPCGSKIDTCASFEDRAVAFFAHRHQAEDFRQKLWPTHGEILTAEQARAKPTNQTEDIARFDTQVEKQEAALVILYALVKDQQRMPHNAASAPLKDPQDKITLNTEAMAKALRDIMANFGYSVAAIQ